MGVLCEELAHNVRADTAILDGEICCLDPDGRSRFYSLLFRRDWPFFYAFDLLFLDGQNVRGQPLLTRKRLLRQIMPRIDSRLVYVDHLSRRGRDVDRAVSERDLEGTVAKWSRALYGLIDSASTWIKIRNPECSEMIDRQEMFAARARGSRSR